MNCDICGKMFTGAINYKQHLESEKHKKKVKQLTLTSEICSSVSESEKLTNLNNESFFCNICKVSYYDFSSFQEHVLSLEHANMVKNSFKNVENKAFELDTIGGITCSQYMNSKSEISYPKETSILSSVPDYGHSVHPYRYCQQCNKQFSGPEPYQQHIVSKAHIKNANAQDSGNNLLSAFICETCDKRFSGIVPYTQHLNSEVHKKKLQSKNLLDQFKSAESTVTSTTDSVTKNVIQNPQIPSPLNESSWFCTICKKQCSGPIPYNSHVAGEPHKKNVRRVELEKQYKITSGNNIEELSNLSLSLQQQMSSTEKVNPVTQCIKTNTSYSFKGNETNRVFHSGEVESDIIVPIALENFKPLTVNNIDMKFFLPDSELNFDIESKDDSGKNTLLESEVYAEYHNANTVEEAKAEKSSYYTCQVCNVNLHSKEEIASHFESIEHCIKKRS